MSYKMQKQFLVANWITNNNFANGGGEELFEKKKKKKKFFSDLSVTNSKVSIQFLPKEKAIIYADTANFAKDTIFGIAILSELPGLDAAHTGFGIGSGKKNGLAFRHASQLKGKVIEQPLAEFLKATKIKTPGIAFFRFRNEE
jgi:D-alanyl-D-alanine carboxypeptidase/D-alanyl-D-alanine-endopeptidase (penicillin-binding protein 4)